MPEQSLRGKTALITGAAKRIGRAIALAFADEGLNIVVHYSHSATEAEALVYELGKRGVKAWAIKADFEKPEEYESLIDRVIQAAGHLDILVNNASIFPPSTIQQVTWENVMTSVEVNAWAPFVISRAFALKARRGTIINLLDTRITSYDFQHVAYILSKRMFAQMTNMMALECAPDITVNAVAPGVILPPPGQDESYLKKLADTMPLKRHGDPRDVAEAAVFLAKSSFITGQVIYVDGGRHLKEPNNG